MNAGIRTDLAAAKCTVAVAAVCVAGTFLNAVKLIYVFTDREKMLK